MTKEQLQQIALDRSEKIFTKEFFITCTDSWYFDELDHFKESFKISKNKKPTVNDCDVYMKCLENLKDKYEDNFFSSELAQSDYGICISHIKNLLDTISKYSTIHSKFKVDDNVIQQIKDIGNIFVKKHNEFCNN